MGICTYFRGRLTFNELANSEVGVIQTLRHIIFEDSKSKERQDAKQGEILEDEMMDL